MLGQLDQQELLTRVVLSATEAVAALPETGLLVAPEMLEALALLALLEAAQHPAIPAAQEVPALLVQHLGPDNLELRELRETPARLVLLALLGTPVPPELLAILLLLGPSILRPRLFPEVLEAMVVLVAPEGWLEMAAMRETQAVEVLLATPAQQGMQAIRATMVLAAVLGREVRVALEAVRLFLGITGLLAQLHLVKVETLL